MRWFRRSDDFGDEEDEEGLVMRTTYCGRWAAHRRHEYVHFSFNKRKCPGSHHDVKNEWIVVNGEEWNHWPKERAEGR